MSIEILPEYAEQIRHAYFVWLTTVRADGMPQPTPVWFSWDGDTFLIYSRPDAQKVRNIRQNRSVALNFVRDHEGEEYIVIMGQATIDDKTSPSNQVAAYATKYAEGTKRIGMTPEDLAQTYSVPIRVTPTQVRGH